MFLSQYYYQSSKKPLLLKVDDDTRMKWKRAIVTGLEVVSIGRLTAFYVVSFHWSIF